ncbi:hypothetical protein [Streptomyces collinus]|uniref:AG2 protein n=1 Tax=Streptomyces collinus (strain DSM 40733 / Tue 365) TaxID=1214242 RepID=S5VW85_STRC3|nr:hypothetical protein [Streptomyces collinus]AGS72160.1 hypothetical protein B446_26760 [Streptomyces collinus Tu 365]UJA10815.1 hypothetical protein HGI10_47860 [Streptomyces collinus]UJA14321.1 hypothetical protein HGI09_16260 [Streptomyces collinus]
MALTFTDLIEVDLGKLATAVSDWKKAVEGLKKSAESARTGMQAKSDSARWAGVNATVTREFVTKTAKEVSDLHAEANSIYQVLDDGHTELLSLQNQMKAAVQNDAVSQGIRVEDIGGGKVRCFFPHVRGDTDERTQEQLDGRQALEDRINRILAHADEIDASVARALAKSHGNDRHNAGHSTYESLNDAEVERALELAHKGKKMSDAELRELNELLRFNSAEKDGEFATEFYQGLGGPEKTLQFYAEMSIDGTDAGATKTRLDEVRDLQKVMGYTLANATDPDHAHHLPDTWSADFRRLGTQQIGWEKGQWNKPYGYQVLGGLLRYGDYDPRFINPIAEHITQLHKKDPYFFLSNKPAGSPDAYGFNPSGRLGSGNDPLNSVLEALGHSPEASQKFFTTPPTAYNEDGTVKKGGDPGFTSYLDLFTDKDFEWTIDTNAANVLADEDKTKAALTFGPEALGHALESATTGRPYDSDATADAIKHTDAQAHLVSEIVDKFGGDPELIRHNENGDLEDEESGPLYALRGSLGDITAEYMGDFQQAMYQEDSGSDLFPTFGSAADLDPNHVARFLGEVGQDPDAYSAITTAQQAYTTDVVDHVINGSSHSTASMDGRVGAAVAPGSAIAGIMSDARAHAIYHYHTASDTEFNDAAAEKQKWVNRILGMGIEKVGERVPIAGAPLEWASEDIQESIMKSIEQDTTSEAETEAGEEYTNGRTAALDSAGAAVDHALTKNNTIDPDTADDLRRAARTSAGHSHSDGAQWKSESGH